LIWFGRCGANPAANGPPKHKTGRNKKVSTVASLIKSLF